MGVITRFVDVLNSNINAALDSVEKPEHMLRMIIQEMEEALVEVRSHAAQVIAEKKQVERKVAALTEQALDWQNKAEMALSKDREDLARQALVAKSECESELAVIQEQLSLLSENLNAITEDANGLQQKLAEAKQKQKSLVRRQDTAVVQLNSRKTIDKNKLENVQAKYERLHNKVTELESQVEAYDMTAPVTLMDEFRKLEADSKVEDELEALKKKVANA